MRVTTPAEIELVRRRVRAELALLGPKRVQQGMIAFEHRNSPTREHFCCFLSHACGEVTTGRLAVGMPNLVLFLTDRVLSAIESNFEQWQFATIVGRDWLYQECVMFLAEHGIAVEQASVPVNAGAE